MISVKHYSGHIKNWKNLCKILNIESLNQNDCVHQILISGYKKWGNSLPKHLNGIFCFAIYDSFKNLLFCARDPFGAKPFYYFFKNAKLLYSSNLLDILKNKQYTKSVDLSVLQNYLSYTYVPGENLLFKDIKKLMPGCCLLFKNGKLTIKKYFNTTKKQDNTKTLNYWVSKLHKTIKKSTLETVDKDELQYTQFMLSSGVDSSYLFKITNVKNAITFGYKDKQYDESFIAQNFAQNICKDCNKILINSKQFFKEIKYAIKTLELPISSPASIVYSYALKHIPKNTKICLSGDLSDELFGGYDIYKLADEFGDDLQYFYIGKTNIMQEDMKQNILKHYNPKQSPTDILQKHYLENKEYDSLTKMMQTDLYFWVEGNSMLNAYKYAAKNNIEVRMPLADIRVLKLANKIPSKFKVNKNENKIILRQCANTVLDNNLANKKKSGFVVPLRKWLTEDIFIDSIKEKFNSQNASIFFNIKYINNLVREFLDGNSNLWKPIWNIYIFLVWYEEFF